MSDPLARNWSAGAFSVALFAASDATGGVHEVLLFALGTLWFCIWLVTCFLLVRSWR